MKKKKLLFFSLRPTSLAQSMYLTLECGTQSPQTQKRLSMLQIRYHLSLESALTNMRCRFILSST